MQHYRQHMIVLIGTWLECILLGLLSVGLTHYVGHTFFLLLLLPALLIALRNSFAWKIFRIRLHGQHLPICSLQGLIIKEQPLDLNISAGFHTHQNLSGYLFDYGNIQIDTSKIEVKLLYIAQFSTLRQQLDRLEQS